MTATTMDQINSFRRSLWKQPEIATYWATAALNLAEGIEKKYQTEVDNLREELATKCEFPVDGCPCKGCKKR